MFEKKYSHSVLVKGIIIAILLSGILFRFAYLGKKNYWNDEAYTSLRIAGYTYRQVEDEIATNQLFEIDDLQKYQRHNPDYGMRNVINSLLEEDAHISPLYFVITRLWTDIWGLAPQQTRLVAAMISLLALPCMYWLSYELFQRSLTAWIATLFVAISPLQVLYAQEARNYSILAVVTLLSSASLLRALRVQKPFAWINYAIAAGVALYANLLSSLVLLGHGIYTILYSWGQGKLYRNYGLATLGSIACFVPWILASHEIAEPEYVAKSISLLTLAKRLFFNVTVNFFDIQTLSNRQIFDLKFSRDTIRLDLLDPVFYVLAAFVGFSLYALYFLIKTTPKRIYGFVIALVGANLLPFLFSDLLIDGQRSTVTRYLIPSLLGIQLATAYLLGTKLFYKQTKIWQQQTLQLIVSLLFFCSFLSCFLSMRAETWWTKYSSYSDPEIAQIINKTAKPVVISSSPMRAISLSYLLNPEVKFMIVPRHELPKIPEDKENVFLYWPKPYFIDYLEEQNQELAVTHQLDQFWQLTR
ncbi:MAG: glycosyltransferase family 39 protein [Cyanobacteria bacterium J06626_18]